MAYIRKLPSGKFNAVVRLPNGKRKSITDPLKRVVEQRARELESSFARGHTYVPDRKLTVARWEAKWTASRAVESATAKKNASHMANHVLPHWGNWPLASIDRLDVQTWVKEMTHAGVGASTVVASYNLLSRMLADAVLSRKVPANPCHEIKLPVVVKPAERWLTKEEYGRIQLALAVTPQAPVWQALVALGCYSGLRWPGELCGLDIERVDFARGLVHVQQVLTRDGLRAYPKNDASVRWVPFPPEVAGLLWQIIGDRGSGPVFTTERGLRINEANFRNRIWRPALEAAGVEQVRPYVLRHTCASWLAQAGVSSDEIADILGHSTTRMTRQIYRHMRPDAHERVRAAWVSDVGPATALERVRADDLQ